MATSAVMSSKGQLVIPAQLRDELGLRPGVRVLVKRQGNGLFIEPGGYEAVFALRGKYVGMAMETDLAASRQRDEEKLDALFESVRS
jgi:AbrB family looped-hinge helix DNA binding protein